MQKNRNIQHGQILRVRLHNFMTFSDEEFQPEQGLNLLLAANGSGKSAISCAICLACGGVLKLSGRASKSSGYIKEGETDGFVELDLMNDPETGSIFSIRRTMTADDKSTWMIGGRRTDEKGVLDLMDSLDIHVDSLGIYMPQERVGEFITLKPDAILTEVLKVVQDVDLAGKQISISDSQRSLQSLSLDVEGKSHSLELLTNQVRGMERLAVKQKRKKELLDKIRLFEHLRLVLGLKEIESEAKQLTVNLNEANSAVRDLEIRENSIDRQLDQCTRRMTHRSEVLRVSSGLLAESSSCVTKSMKRYDDVDNDLSLMNDKYENQAKYRRDLESDIEVMNRKLTKLMEQEEIKHDASKTSEAAISGIQRMIIQVRDQRQAKREELDSATCQHQIIDKRLSRVKPVVDEKIVRLIQDNNKARAGSGDDVNALMRYLSSSSTSGSVFGPIAREIDSTGDDMIDLCLQLHLSLDMKNTIIAVGDDAYQGLRQEVHGRLRLTLFSIIKSPSSSSSSSARSRTPSSPSGLEVVGWLGDLISCNDVIRSCLSSFSDLKYVLLVKGDASLVNQDFMRSIMTSHSMTSLTVYCQSSSSSNNNLIKLKMTKSRYNPNSFPYSSMIVNTSAYAKLSSSSSSSSDHQQVELDVIEADRLKAIMMRLRDEDGRLADVEAGHQRDKTNHQREVAAYLSCVNEIKMTRQKTKKLESDLAGVDEDGDGNKTKALLMEEVAIRGEMNSHQTNWIEMSVRLLVMEEAMGDLKLLITDKKEEASGIKTEIKAKKKIVDQLSQTKSRLDVDRTILMDDLRAAGPIPVEIQAMDISLDECDRQLVEMKEESSLISSNNKALELYESSCMQLTAKTEEINGIKRNIDGLTRSIDNELKPWSDELKAIIQVMNIEYCSSLKYIGFAGRVSLDDDPSIVSDWKLNLFFGNDEAHVEPLSSSRNSGGEKAIATSCFMLALQSISSSPWRLVDEINQGLDEVNERKLIHLMVHSCTVKPIQVLFLTPKLPNDCTDLIHPLVTLHTIYNSPTVLCKLNWQLIKQELSIRFPDAMDNFNSRKKREREVVQMIDDSD